MSTNDFIAAFADVTDANTKVDDLGVVAKGEIIAIPGWRFKAEHAGRAVLLSADRFRIEAATDAAFEVCGIEELDAEISEVPHHMGRDRVIVYVEVE